MSAQKRFPPSAKKIKKAKEQGDLAKSKDLTSFLVVLTGMFSILVFRERFGVLVPVLEKCFSPGADFPTKTMLLCGSNARWALLYMLSYPLACVVVVAFVAEAWQAGIQVRFSVLKPQLSKLNPLKGLKKIWGVKEEGEGGSFPSGFCFEVSKILIFLLVLAMISATLGIVYLPSVLEWSPDSLASVLVLLVRAMAFVSATFFVGWMILAISDMVIAKIRWRAKLMMDAEELKKESRESEGDPEQKGLRKQLHQELLYQGILQGVRRAKLVVVNRE